MRRTLRILTLVLVVLVAVAMGAHFGLRGYLSSSGGRQAASDKLTDLFGGAVHVTKLESGYSSTTVTFEIPGEPTTTDGPPAAPVATATVRTDISAVGLATGSEPTALTFSDAKLSLHFDRDGRMLDKLPKPKGTGLGKVPAIQIDHAAVKFVQDGKPDFVATGISVTVADNGNQILVNGKLADPFWGNWTLVGEWKRDGSEGTITLTADAPVRATMEKLRAIPFVPTSTWEAVDLDGTTPVKVTLSRGADGEFAWRIDLQPTATTVHVKPIDLTLTDTSGTVTIIGAKVELAHIVAKTADGTLTGSAVLDFGPEPSKLGFKIAANGLDIRKLPKTWDLPSDFEEGRLKGTAELELSVSKGGKVEPRGTGRGEFDGAKVLGFPVEFAEIRLVGDGQRFRFNAPRKQSQRSPESGLGIVGGTGVSPVHASLPPPIPEPTPILAAFIATAMTGLFAQPPPPPDPAYIQTNLRLRDIELEELLKRLEITSPLRLAGKITVEVSTEIPINGPRNLQTYRIRGKVSAPELIVEGLTIRNAVANVVVKDGVLRLTKLTGDLPAVGDEKPGSFTGTAQFGIEPRTDLTADVVLASVAVGAVLKAFPDLEGTIAGPVSGTISLLAPAGKLDESTALVGSGKLTSPGMTVLNRKLKNATATLSLKDGVLRATDVTAVVEGLPATGSGSVTLAGKFPFTATLLATGADVVDLRRLAPEASLPFDLTGTVDGTATLTGTFAPVTIAAKGTASAKALTVGPAKIDALAFAWAADADAVTLTGLTANVYRGTITGSAKLPLKDASIGSVDVTLSDVDANAMSKAFPGLPVAIEGRIRGSMTAKLPASKPGEPRAIAAGLDLTAPQLKVQGVPARRLQGKLSYADGSIGYKLTGDALGGQFDIDGTYPIIPKKPDPTTGGTIKLQKVNLDRLAAELGLAALTPLRGQVSAVVKFTTPDLIGSGKLEIQEFGWGQAGAATLRADVKLTPDGLAFESISGSFADGSVAGHVRLPLNASRPGRFAVTIENADAGALLTPAGVTGVDGRASVSARGAIGRVTHGSGTIAISRMKWSGLEAIDVLVPFDWTTAYPSGGELHVREATGQIAGGRATAKGTFSWGSATRLDATVGFINVSTRGLIGREGGGIGAGRATGRFDLKSDNLQTINDVRGNLAATFDDTPLFDFPVFRQVGALIAPGRAIGTLRDGELQAHLADSRLRIDRLALSSQALNVFADGIVGLDGRIDLGVTVNTNRLGIDPAVLRALGISLPVIGPIPVAVLLQVGKYLSARLIRAHVGGTVTQPAVNLDFSPILSEEAIRFFIRTLGFAR